MARGSLGSPSCRSRGHPPAGGEVLMRVLVAVDGSAAAENAVALVDAIAWPVDSILRVVTVIEPVLLPISGPAYRDALRNKR